MHSLIWLDLPLQGWAMVCALDNSPSIFSNPQYADRFFRAITIVHIYRLFIIIEHDIFMNNG